MEFFDAAADVINVADDDEVNPDELSRLDVVGDDGKFLSHDDDEEDSFAADDVVTSTLVSDGDSVDEKKFEAHDDDDDDDLTRGELKAMGAVPVLLLTPADVEPEVTCMTSSDVIKGDEDDSADCISR